MLTVSQRKPCQNRQTLQHQRAAEPQFAPHSLGSAASQTIATKNGDSRPVPLRSVFESREPRPNKLFSSGLESLKKVTREGFWGD